MELATSEGYDRVVTPTLRPLARWLYAVVVIAGVGCLVIGASLTLGDHAVETRILGIVVTFGSFLVYRLSYPLANRLFGAPAEKW